MGFVTTFLKLIIELPLFLILNPYNKNMEAVIRTISKEIKIHCKRCEYTGIVTATREYYVYCPNCDESVYVGHLTKE